MNQLQNTAEASYPEQSKLEFNTDSWKEITVQVKPLGKAPAKYGDGVYRFGSPIALSKAMARQGWEIIKRTSSHVYARPPLSKEKQPYLFTFQIPSRQHVLEIAERLFNGQKSWAGIIGDWMVIFLCDHTTEVSEVVSQAKEPIVLKKLSEFTIPASLKFGDSTLWSVSVYKCNNEISYFPDKRFAE